MIFTWHVATSLSPTCFAFHVLPKWISFPTGRKTLHSPSKREHKCLISSTILHNFIVTMTTDAQLILVFLNIWANKLWVKPWIFFLYYPFGFLSIFPIWSGQKFIYLLFVRIFKVMLWLLYDLEKQPTSMSCLLIFFLFIYLFIFFKILKS